MNRILAAAAITLILAGCQGGAQQTGIDLAQDYAVGSVRNLSAGDLAAIKDTCVAAAPSLIAATGAAAPKMVRDVAVYPYAYCEQMLSGSTGNADQSSLTWLPQVLGYVQMAARIAGMVLPVVLSLL
ncbi:MAG TPA: hypothetical protein VN663_23015 [Ramlibacter sp.]|nr:hypothetical protein [Ramlibacter sp.]